MTNKLTKAIQGIDKYIDLLEEKVELLTKCNDTQAEIIATQRESIKELDRTVIHWQDLHDRERRAFEQAAAERDQALNDKDKLQRRYAERGEEIERCGMQMEALRKQNKDWRNRVEKLRDKNDKLGKEGAQMFTDHVKALEFIDSICEMVACDANFDDIADECIRWRKGEWTPTEDESNEEPHRWAVYVVEEKGGDCVFTGFFTDYNLARESVDLMTARGCYEAWVEDKA